MMAMNGVRLLYEAQDFPIFQNRMYPTVESARDCPKGDIQLVEDLATGLVYNAAFRPELMQYDTHYQNEQAISPLFRDHLNNVAEIVEAGMGRVGIVEIGCGKAFFLEMLLAKGFDITGYDPTYEGGNPRIIRKYFQRGEGLVAKGMILRHVLEHIQDPFAFLMTLQDANGGGGKIYIEVPSMEWICARRAWFDIFYEHVNYFRLIDFFRLFEGIEASGYLFGGQYLYVIADLSRLRRPRYDEQNAIDFPSDFRCTLIAQSPEPRAQSPEPRAQSPEPRAQSPEPRGSYMGWRIQRRYICPAARTHWRPHYHGDRC